MNIKNNKRKKDSQQKIEDTFIQLIQTKDVKGISIVDLCKAAQVNRSTFYANYLDIYDLVEKIEERMINDFQKIYEDEINNNYNSNNYLKLFYHIKENQLFYKAYFKLQLNTHFQINKYDIILAKEYYNNKYIKYHAEFFRAGITAIIKIWLQDNCNISPEELFDIVKAEYANKTYLNK